MVRSLLHAHRAEISVTDTDLAARLVVHAVRGMVDGALLVASGRREDPRLAEAIVGHILGAVGAKAPPFEAGPPPARRRRPAPARGKR